MNNKKRADEWVFERELTESRNKAQALILAGEILVRDTQKNTEWVMVEKAGTRYAEHFEFKLKNPGPKDVGRGAQKLRGAFGAWPEIDAAGCLCMDVGSSTGGFTQVLLEKGAAKVLALDVGSHQLHERLRVDPRVISVEQQHILRIEKDAWQKWGVEPAFDIMVCDVSFISVTLILPTMESLLKQGGQMILLVKPQFEVGAAKAPKGIVKDPLFRQEALDKVLACVETLGSLRARAHIECPLPGSDGNREYLLWLSK